MNQDDLNEAYRRTALIGGAMMTTLVMYAVVVLAIQSTRDPFAGFAPWEDDGSLRHLFLGLSVLQIVAIHIIRKRALPSAESLGGATAVEPSDRSPLLARLVSISIVTFAIAESIAVLGLVLFLLNGDSTGFYMLLFLSFLGFVKFFPKYHQWEAWLQKQRMS